MTDKTIYDLRRDIEKELGFEFEWKEQVKNTEVYYKIYEPLMKRLQDEKKEVEQIQSEVKQLRTSNKQMADKLKQIETSRDILEDLYKQTQTDLDRHKGTITLMPKHVSLIQKYVDESIDGITVTEIARIIKKSRTTIYTTTKWLVDNNHIVKQGKRYLGIHSVYNIRT